MLIAGTIEILALSFGYFDCWIASYNIAKMGEELMYEDASYLCSLSEKFLLSAEDAFANGAAEEFWKLK